MAIIDQTNRFLWITSCNKPYTKLWKKNLGCVESASSLCIALGGLLFGLVEHFQFDFDVYKIKMLIHL